MYKLDPCTVERREKILIAGINGGKTEAEIANELELTRERVRQLKNKAIKKYGRKIFNPPTFYSIAKAARLIGVGRDAVSKACKENNIAHMKRGTAFVLSDAQLKALDDYFERTRSRQCPECGSVFRVNGTGLICGSEQCKKQRAARLQRDRTRKKRLAARNGVPSRLDWIPKFAATLNRRHLPEPNESNLILLGEAARLSALSKDQIGYLANRGVIPVFSHPTRKWGKKPARAFLTETVQLAGHFYTEHVQQLR